jgi:hypothetical protein
VANGLFYERTTAAFANSLRQSGPFFREAQLDTVGDWNTVPADFPALPIPDMTVGFNDGEPQLEGSNASGPQFEALETQSSSSRRDQAPSASAAPSSTPICSAS